ncbi:MAG: cytidylate kinase-like family protein [Clostridia bacterium]|nr:cytidylate kinase-like family protein [Clostridia bacterium]MBQ2939107.1 cytidylate kinase-like family protein [Clostridia bacterium]
MNIITISREFGSGGRELGKRLADHLGYDYYDSEIIAAVAKNSGMDADYIRTLGDDGWQQYPITFRSTLGGTLYTQSNKVQLLLEQKRVIEGIAALGKDCIIVGRNADVLLKKYQPFNIFVCAETETKLKRSLERAPEGEQLTEKQLRRKLKKIDKARAQTRALLSSSPWGQRKEYHLTVNTTGWEIKKMVPAVADFAMAWFGRME